MDLSLPQLDFTVSVNACHDQIMHKMEVLTNMEIQLLRKFQHQVNNSDMHYKMIHDVRVLIVNIQEIYKDVKEYFDEMGIKFIYDFFRKIQVLMVCGYNFLSQALLVNVDKIDAKKTKDAEKANTLDCKVCKCTCSDGQKNKKRQIKEVEQYDYKISMLQNEQQKITSEIQSIYEKIMVQKPVIERTKPSLAIRELEDMKEHIENVMESTNSIFEETYMMKYVEFKNYLTQIKKPEDIVDYFISNMNFNMKEKFLKAMQKAVYKAQHMDERIQRMHLRDIEVQTDKIKQQLPERQPGYRGFSTLKYDKNGSLLTKQRKYNQKIIAELQYMTKQINSLVLQNEKLKKQLQKKQEERLKYKQNYDTLEQLYSKRSYELQVTQQQKVCLSHEKEAESKKLRLEINQLRKEQVQMINQQTQILIPPEYTTTATETEIVFFQNQVDNEIINVLKKSNEKMIQNLNEKEKKLRELVSIREEYIFLKDCKVMCLQFLEDLREVITYKMNEVKKNQQKMVQKKKIRQPIIPLNINTSNNSVMITINKLTEEIKTLLLNYDFTRKRANDKQKSLIRNNSINHDSRNSSRKSSKASQPSLHQSQPFFRNSPSKKGSIISIKEEEEVFHRHTDKKSSYLEQFLNKEQKKTKAEILAINHLKNQVIDQANVEPIISEKSLILEVQSPLLRNAVSQKIDTQTERKRNSSFQQKPINNIKKVNQLQHHLIKKVGFSKDKFVQTDIIKEKSEKKILFTENNLSVLNETSQQTDISLQDLTQFQMDFSLKVQQISKLKAEIESIANNENNQQRYTTRKKNPYIRKPGGRLTADKVRSSGTQKYDVSVNVSHTSRMNDAQISQLDQQYKEQDQQDDDPLLAKTIPMENSLLNANIYKHPRMTLESRLSQLINQKNAQSSSVSNLVVLKKSSQEYRKRVSHLYFDDLKTDKHLKQKQKEFRKISRQESLLIATQNEKKWKEIVNKFQKNTQHEKENAKSKPKHQPFTKSNFVDKILEVDSKNHSTHSNTSTLIEVSKKTPLRRENKLSPNKFELADIVFARTVRQMFMSNDSKQQLFKKIEEVYKEMEKEKQTKRIKKITKNSFTGRELRSENSKKQLTQIYKLGQGQY